MSLESSPAVIKYSDGVKVFSGAGGVWKCCWELRLCLNLREVKDG